MPYAHRGEAVARLDVQVIAGGVHVGRQSMAELDADVGLIGRLVFREPDVAVDAEQRASNATWRGDELGRDLSQMRREGFDEGESRLEKELVIACPVRLEPAAVVVGAELLEEREERRGEGGFGHAGK